VVSVAGISLPSLQTDGTPPIVYGSTRMRVGVYGCMGVWVCGCMGVWVYGCVWVYG
jgi:hypothetical protein